MEEDYEDKYVGEQDYYEVELEIEIMGFAFLFQLSQITLPCLPYNTIQDWTQKMGTKNAKLLSFILH